MKIKKILAVLVAGVSLGIIVTSYNLGGNEAKPPGYVQDNLSGTVAKPSGIVQANSSNSPWMSHSFTGKFTGKIGLCSPIERLSHVKKMCNANENFHEEYSPWFIVDDEHQNSNIKLTSRFLLPDINQSVMVKNLDATHLGFSPFQTGLYQLLYCNIAKTGSSTMKTLLMTSTLLGLNKPIPKRSHNDEDLYARGLHYQKYSSKYQNYTKIMIVRHPFERVISAYKDKFTNKDAPKYFTDMKIDILQTFSKEERKLDFTFPQFVSFLQGKHNTKILKKYMDNEHWKSYEHMCSPCLIPYDYIMRTESLGTEVDRYVLPLINRTPDVLNNSTRRVSQTHDHQITNTYGRHLEYFEQLSKSQVRFLKERYSDVALMYGYRFKEKHLLSSCEIKTNDGSICC